METKHLNFRLEVKADDDSGSFTGYASTFNDEPDSYGDVIAPGAFAESLKRHADKKTMPALLWQHDATQPIGVWESMEEDSHGLKVRGRLLVNAVAKAREAYELLKEKAVNGLSIGFMPNTWEYNKETDVMTLTEVDLWETSIVTFPANRSATVNQVRSAIRRGESVDARTLERAVRDELGFSARAAKRLLAEGMSAAFDVRDEQPEAETSEALSALNSFLNQIKA